MVYLHARSAAAAILLLGALYLPASASGRRRTEMRPLKPPVSFQPSAGAPEGLDAPILSGLDFTAIAPPGDRLRVIEDEPYILLWGYNKKGLRQLSQGISKLVLHSSSPDGGSYEAKVSLRYDPQKDDQNALLLSFDTAAHYAYKSGLLKDESRGSTAYSLREIRSPLGLTDPRDKENLWREYLAYNAAILNPNSSVARGITTPYQYTTGEIKVVRRVDACYYLLTINFEANEYAHALMLTENIARCIINRLQPGQDPAYRLTYAAYYPEFELAKPYYEGERINPTTADLTERPGEGCGIGAAPITGNVCPECGEGGEGGPFWPASPFGDSEYGQQLGRVGAQPECSHCLLLPPRSVDGHPVECGQRRCKQPCPNRPPLATAAPVCDGCGHQHALRATSPETPSGNDAVSETLNLDNQNHADATATVARPRLGRNAAEAEAKSTAEAVRENAQGVRTSE